MSKEKKDKGKWTEESASDMIKRNRGRVKVKKVADKLTGKTTTYRTVNHKSPGIKVLGAIDYLVNNHRYVYQKV